MAARSQKGESRICQASQGLGPQWLSIRPIAFSCWKQVTKSAWLVDSALGERSDTRAKGMGVVAGDIFEDSLPRQLTENASKALKPSVCSFPGFAFLLFLTALP